VDTAFGPEGQVWSSTVLRVPLPGRRPPYGLVYVDLDDGPRVLGHSRAEATPAVGERVTLQTVSDLGDLVFERTAR
jgi:uncharacterized OB-fold protein